MVFRVDSSLYILLVLSWTPNSFEQRLHRTSCVTQGRFLNSLYLSSLIYKMGTIVLRVVGRIKRICKALRTVEKLLNRY